MVTVITTLDPDHKFMTLFWVYDITFAVATLRNTHQALTPSRKFKIAYWTMYPSKLINLHLRQERKLGRMNTNTKQFITAYTLWSNQTESVILCTTMLSIRR